MQSNQEFWELHIHCVSIEAVYLLCLGVYDQDLEDKASSIIGKHVVCFYQRVS